MNPGLILGILGAALILTAFILDQTHVWKDTDLIYDVVNLAGSSLLLYYGAVSGTWPFVILNSVWALVSLRDVFIDLKALKH